jgi:parallel beta-helix repeat protein
MNFKKKIRNRRLFISVFLTILALFVFNQISYFEYNNQNVFNDKIEETPKISKYWNEEEVHFIHIRNDNWSETDLDWIQNKTGTWNDPHIIENITINAGRYGIGILIEDSSDHFLIKNCSVYNSSTGFFNTAGIYIKHSNNGTIHDNNLSYNNGSGIILDNCINITISNNYLTNNKEDGIYVTSLGKNNTIYDNDIVNNTVRGLDFNATTTGNLIYENNFTNNGINAMDNGTYNQWYNNKIGNYWDDYTKCDANRDNIGDWPYEIPGDAGSQDLYPICYKVCVFERREAKEQIEDENEETIAAANELFENFIDNIGILAFWIIVIEGIFIGIIIINKKIIARSTEDDLWNKRK